MILLAQSDAVVNKALDTLTQAIQGGLLGVAIILAVAIICLAITIGMSNRASAHNLDEMMKFNGRLVNSIEKMDSTLDKMDSTLDKMSSQLVDIPKGYASLLENVQNEMKTRMSEIEVHLEAINVKLKKIRPDTQPIQPLSAPETKKPGEA